MSKLITRSKPARSAVRAAATMPPAGPDRMASRPAKRAPSIRPPCDCMNSSRVSGSDALSWSTCRRRTGER